jgi:hypothetical protein
MRPWLITFAILALTPAFAQPAVSLPAWLESYPGAQPAVHSTDSLVESSYTVAAQPEQIIAHYRQLFEGAGLPYQPNPDGLGTSIRAATPECDLLIQIRTREEGVHVAVNCAAKSAPSAPISPGDVKMITGHPQAQPVRAQVAPGPPAHPMTADEMMEQHHRIAAEMGLHRQHPDAPAPPLVWPSWLASINGAPMKTTRGETNWKDPMLIAQYTSHVPMTEIYHFYRDLLNAHEYPARSSMSTGQTMTGVQQNAIGYVEGFNYPDGAPGAYSTIHVSFNRDVLNGPITVTLKFTTHEFIAKRGY